MQSRPAGRRNHRRRNAVIVSAAALLGVAAMPVYSADPDGTADQLQTATPIKHVIVVIGENRAFDHVYSTYVPKSGDSILNLLQSASFGRMEHRARISPQRSNSRPRARRAISSASTRTTRPPTRLCPPRPWAARRTNRT